MDRTFENQHGNQHKHTMNKPARVILASRNESKIHQITALFEGTGVSLVGLEETTVEGDIPETADTLYGNAMLKAKAAHDNRKCPDDYVISDDTGLCVNAFKGWPGVHSARWAGDVSTDEITRQTLLKMEGISDRTAYFETVVVLMAPSGANWKFVGRAIGTILTEPRCKPQPKMPYSGIFQPDGYDLVWAQMPTEDENRISHRGIAFRSAIEFLESLLFMPA